MAARRRPGRPGSAHGAGTDLLREEHRRLPEIAPRLPLPVPTPQYLGEPSPLFPQPWTIVAWVSGEPADGAEIEDESAAAVLAKFLRALHTEVPASAPRDGGKGERVRNAQLEFDADLIEVLGEDRVRRIEEIWRDGSSAPDRAGPRVWVHQDLHPANVVANGGALAGVIDFGELCPGDPAVDLAAAWVLLLLGSTCDFFDHYGDVDPAMRRRARAAALCCGIFLVRMGVNGQRGLAGGKPGWLAAGRKALDRVLEVC